jgi:hypothetical protein
MTSSMKFTYSANSWYVLTEFAPEMIHYSLVKVSESRTEKHKHQIYSLKFENRVNLQI